MFHRVLDSQALILLQCQYSFFEICILTLFTFVIVEFSEASTIKTWIVFLSSRQWRHLVSIVTLLDVSELHIQVRILTVDMMNYLTCLDIIGWLRILSKYHATLHR